MTTRPTADVLIAPGHRVFINGVEIGNVLEIAYERDMNGPDRMRIEFMPTSMVQGKPPEAVFRDTAGMSDPDARVDIDAAIERAKVRAESRGKRVAGT